MYYLFFFFAVRTSKFVPRKNWVVTGSVSIWFHLASFAFELSSNFLQYYSYPCFFFYNLFKITFKYDPNVVFKQMLCHSVFFAYIVLLSTSFNN